MAFQQIQKYERGINRVAASTLVRVAQTLGTTVAALMNEGVSTAITPMAEVQLSAPGALDLLAAFAKISDGETRRALVTLASSLAFSKAREAA